MHPHNFASKSGLLEGAIGAVLFRAEDAGESLGGENGGAAGVMHLDHRVEFGALTFEDDGTRTSEAVNYLLIIL